MAKTLEKPDLLHAHARFRKAAVLLRAQPDGRRPADRAAVLPGQAAPAYALLPRDGHRLRPRRHAGAAWSRGKPEEECESDDDRRRREVERELRTVEAKLAKHEQEQGPEDERKQLAAEQETLRREYERWRCDHHHHKPPPVRVTVDCGWAVDCEGREIIVRTPQVVDLRGLLSREDRREIEKAEHGKCATRPVVELTICYCEQQTYPSRPIVQDNCDLPQKCRYGRVREGYRFRASLTHQPPDTRCSNCCDPCESECVVLARISWPVDDPLCAADIDWAAAPRDQRLSIRGDRRHQLGARREL